MSTRTIAVVFLALFCGASMAVGVMWANQNKKLKPEMSMAETVQVVVAAAEIPRGKMVTDKDIELRSWPKELSPAGTLSELAAAVDRAAIGQLVKGEPVLETKLAPKNAGRGLAALIPDGFRAYTIQTSRVAANVAGFILPGNKADLLLHLKGTSRGEDRTGGGCTVTLLQAVEVLAVEQRLLESPEDKVGPNESSSVTLLVTPDQAAKLDLASNMGILSLALRNPDDKAPAVTEPATMSQIMVSLELPTEIPDDEPRPPVKVEQVAVSSPTVAKPRVMRIVTLRGIHRGSVSVTDGSERL